MLAVFRELRELRNEFYDIFDKEYDKNVKVFPEPVLKQLRKLSEQEDRLRTALDDSVIRCPICGSWERDVEYVSKFESWFCVNCAKDTY